MHASRWATVWSGLKPRCRIWRESMLTVLSEDYGFELDWDRVTADTEHPSIDALVAAATVA